jgi:hypothetical protein
MLVRVMCRRFDAGAVRQTHIGQAQVEVDAVPSLVVASRTFIARSTSSPMRSSR